MENKNISSKEKFTAPKAEIVLFNAEDVITTSGAFYADEDVFGEY